jgi:hypothetical protein
MTQAMSSDTVESMKRVWWLAVVAVLAGCGRLDELQYDPPITGEQWCQERPCVDVGDVVLNEPLGTFLVFLLAALWIAVGLYFLIKRRGQSSRTWLGVALVLGGLGAAQAGVSYQAFSYQLKCAGRDTCLYTNGFEVGYSLTQAWSVSAMVIAVAYACTVGSGRRGLVIYAIVNAAVYMVVTVVGVMAPSKFLLSFELLMLFALPGIILSIVLGARSKVPAGRPIMVAAILLIVVNAAYFAYYAAGITETLWDSGNGFYFSANDVLHIGMIGWLAYVAFALGPKLVDYPSTMRPAPANLAR